MSNIEKRGYEVRAVKNIREAFTSHRCVLAVGPTGCGKTVVASMLIKQEHTARVLFVAHRYELINQAHAQIAAHGIDAGVIMSTDEKLNGKERVKPDARVQVASVQTACRRGAVKNIDLIVFDEAHRVMAASYQKIADQHPRAKVLGLTATPIRLDGKGLGDFFEEMVVIAKPSELYADGYLAKPRVYVAPLEVRLELATRSRGAATNQGDFTPSALAKIVDDGALVGKVVDECIRLAPKIPKVVFAGTVEHSKRIVAQFKARRIKAAHVDGYMDADDRRRVLDQLRTGKIEVISNVDVLSEGWDLPAIGAVVIARPTKSIARLLQMIGRALRPYKGRTPIVLDHGNSILNLQVRPDRDIDWSLESTKENVGALGDEVVKACPDCLVAIPAGCTECPACGAAQPKTERQEREELEAKLEELNASRMRELRARVEEMAAKKNAPPGWVDLVLREMAA